MTPPVLTKDFSPIPLEWATETGNVVMVTHPMTANVVAIRLGGLWKGATISAEDIQSARTELWTRCRVPPYPS